MERGLPFSLFLSHAWHDQHHPGIEEHASRTLLGDSQVGSFTKSKSCAHTLNRKSKGRSLTLLSRRQALWETPTDTAATSTRQSGLGHFKKLDTSLQLEGFGHTSPGFMFEREQVRGLEKDKLQVLTAARRG